jgi:hypothetical protein
MAPRIAYGANFFLMDFVGLFGGLALGFIAFVLCNGGVFAAASTARSNRSHASGCRSGSFFLELDVMAKPRKRPRLIGDPYATTIGTVASI